MRSMWWSPTTAPRVRCTETITVTVAEVNLAPRCPIRVTRPTPKAPSCHCSSPPPIPTCPPTPSPYGAAGLPAGLSIDPACRERSRAPSASGVPPPRRTPSTVTVTDNGTPVLAGQTVFDWTCTPVNQPPVLDPVGDHTTDDRCGTDVHRYGHRILTSRPTPSPSPWPAVPAGAVIDPLSECSPGPPPRLKAPAAMGSMWW